MTNAREFVLCFVAMTVCGCLLPTCKRVQQQSSSARPEGTKSTERAPRLDEQEIAKLVQRHSAAAFPPQGLGPASFTYELQRYFKAQGRRAHAFMGSLEDIKETEAGIVIEFLCPLGDATGPAVALRLTIPEEATREFFSANRGTMERAIAELVHGPEYCVVATVDRVTAARIYESEIVGEGPDVSIDTSSVRRCVVVGRYLGSVGARR